MEESTRHFWVKFYYLLPGLPFDSVWVAPDRHGNPQPHFKLPRLPKNWQKAVVPPRSPEVQAQLDAMNEAYAKSMSKRSKGAHGDKKSFTAQANSSTIPRNCLHECTICKNAALTKTTPTFSNPNHAGYDQPDYKPSTMPTLDLCKGNEPNPVQPESNIITLPPPYEEVSPVSDCEWLRNWFTQVTHRQTSVQSYYRSRNRRYPLTLTSTNFRPHLELYIMQ